jgi:hypothetical protein
VHEKTNACNVKAKKTRGKIIKMTSHAAIRDAVVEMSRRMGRNNLDVPEMKALMEQIERSSAGPEFTTQVRTHLSSVAVQIGNKDVQAIQSVYPDFPLTTIVERTPKADQDAVWQALGMVNMLLTTLQMVPPDMLEKIETMTNTMMGSLQQGGQGGLGELFQGMAGMMNAEQEDEDNASPIRPRPKTANTPTDKKSEFRRKMC